eukprot:TRINITY_DN3515_c0_g1_i1.p1 TRINITY_DN3515_c0_g1~~TRINITY_DN3515_c0_g1_i1.p1  ORF type:complete len:730 (-),score=250.69 TRINITY_DN3515_c0_g1_i1:71-2260(-)
MSETAPPALKQAIQQLTAQDSSECETPLRVLINYAVDQRLQVTIRSLGAIEKIVELLSSDNQVIQMLSAWALTNLANEESNREAILKAGAVKRFIPTLANSTNPDVLAKTLWLLTNLATNEANRKYLSLCGVPKLMSNLLKFPVESVVEEALKPLRNLVIELECQKNFAQSGGLTNLISLLTHSNVSIIIESLQVLYNLTIGTDEMRRLVVSAGVLPPLIFNLSPRNEEITEHSLKLLITLSLTEDLELTILHAGVLLPVVDLFHSPRVQTQEEAAMLLSNLSCNETIRENLRYCGLVTPLTERLSSPHHTIQEQAARLITNLAMDDYNRVELLDAGAKKKLETMVASGNPNVVEAAKMAINNLSVPVGQEVRTNIEEKFANVKIKDDAQPEAHGDLRRIAAQIRPQLLRREKVCRELHQTEKTYVDSLQTAIRVYLNPVMDSVLANNPIIPDDDVKALFSIIEIIAKINAQFFKELDALMAKFDSNDTLLGPPLLSLTQKLKYYSKYITGYDNTMRVYAQCLKSSPRFAELIEKARSQPDIKGLDLLSFLIMPVQRIPRYILLLGDILKHTPKDHKDYKDTEKALDETKGIADFLNEAKRQTENAQRVVAIQESLQGLDEQLAKDGRMFVREGCLIMKTKGGSKYANLFLFSDILLHAAERKQKYRLKDKVALSELSVIDIPDTDLLKNSFKLVWGKDNQWIVSANSIADKKAWVGDLTKQIASAKAK